MDSEYAVTGWCDRLSAGEMRVPNSRPLLGRFDIGRADEWRQRDQVYAPVEASSMDQLKQVFDALRELMMPSDPSKRSIGFITHEDKKAKE
jgi:hypothetical protein